MKENIKYMLKNWIAWDKKSLIYFLIRVPALVFQPIVTAYIPKAMIDCINDGVTVGRLILVVALLSVLVALTTWLAPFMQELLNALKAEKRIKEQWSFTEATIHHPPIFLIPAISFWFALWAL